MRHLRFTIAALALVFSWQAHALTIDLDASLLKDANGNPFPNTGLVILVASTNDSTFNGPTPLNFVNGDDIIVGKIDLSAPGLSPGDLDASFSTTNNITSSNPLKLFWFPTLTLASTAPGQNCPYGSYTDPVGIDGSQPWFGASAGSTIDFKFFTSDADPNFALPGSNPDWAGLATNFTASPITINTQPADTSANVGSTANFSVSATGNSLTYQWRKNGVNLSNGANVSGSTTANLTLSNLQSTDAASYSVYITSSDSFTTSASATLTVIDPYIVSQPANSTVNAAETATFSVSAAGSGTLSYQWQKDGSALSDGAQPSGATVVGASAATLSIAGAQHADAGNYSVIVTGDNGTITSSAASLTVNDAPVVFTAPVSDTASNLNAGDSIVLSVVTTGSTPISYQWKQGLVNLADGTLANHATVTGATSASLTLDGVLASDAGVYTCVASNVVGTTTSHSTTLSVADPVITAGPNSFTAECGAVWPSLSVTVAGSAPLTYQWYTPDANGTAIDGATNDTLSLTNTFASAGDYVVVVSNVFGSSITSAVATVTVTDVTQPNVSVIGPPTMTLCIGDPYVEQGASASDSCDGALLPNISGTVDTNAAGNYTITYSAMDSHNNVGVDYRTVTVQVCTSADPSITTQPVSQSVVIGQKGVTMNVAATGATLLHYQWYKSGTLISGKTTSTLTFGGIKASDQASYYCVVKDTAGTATSQSAFLQVYMAPTVSGPGNVKVVAGNNAYFKATAGPSTAPTTSGAFTFQWTKNNVPVTDGGNISISTVDRISILTVHDAQSDDQGVYLCTVGNASPASATAPNNGSHGNLTVLPDTKPAVASILHPSSNLHYTNGLADVMGGTLAPQNNLAPDLDIDGKAVDNGFITNVVLLRTNPPSSLSNNVAVTYRTNSAGHMLPGSLYWTNHVTLLPGTNTFIAVAYDTTGAAGKLSAPRTYYFLTNGTVTINFDSSLGSVIGVKSVFGTPVSAAGPQQLPMGLGGFKLTAKPNNGHKFHGWTLTDSDSNPLGSSLLSSLTFTTTNGLIINADFQ